MNIVKKKIADLKSYKLNAKLHPGKQIEGIAESIRRFGFTQPIVINEDNTIIIGHGRLEGARLAGLTDIPCLVHDDLTDGEERALRILDNKLNESPFDQDLLTVDLETIDFDFEPFNIDLEGYSFEAEEPEAKEDDFEAPPIDEIVTDIKPGDIIELGRHRLMCGDSTKNCHCDHIDMVITDPPYGVSYVGKTKKALTIQSDDLDENQLRKMWAGCLDSLLPKLKDGGAFYATVPAGPLRQIFSQELKDRGILRQELVWLKDSMVMGRSDYHYKHEPILYGWKPGAAHYMTPDRSKTDVLEHDRPKRSAEHPTMKPISLWAELIGNSSKQNEIVFDPFLGSGTTLIACEQLNRTCYGMEIDPKYCQVIVDRYNKFTKEQGIKA